MPEPSRRPARILVVEDDRKTAELIALYLRHAEYNVFVEHAGDRALDRINNESFDALVLDVMLPGVDGLTLCRAARSRGGVGVLLLTARTLEEDRVSGLEMGADDYITKPFSPRELVARVGAVLRRAPRDETASILRGPLRIDLPSRRVAVSEQPVDLTASEFNLLVALARRPGHVLNRGQLLKCLPGGPSGAMDRTIDVHIRNLRRKLEVEPNASRCIETVIGVGYRFVEAQPS